MPELSKGIILEWVDLTVGWWDVTRLDKELDIVSPQGKATRRTIVYRLVKDGYLEKHKYKEGSHRRVEAQAPELDWQSADSSAVLDLRFPFGIEDYVKIFPKSIIVVAGASNAGKTAMLYNFILMNMERHLIDLYNSETSPEQMKERFENFEQEIPSPAPWRTFERYDCFADIIDPNRVSVIDYIDFNNEVYRVGEELEMIFRKLNKGVCIAAIQKKRDTTDYKGKKIHYELGYGSDMSIKKASLYLSMDTGKIKIIKAKSWADHTKNPSGLEWGFKLRKGCDFIITEKPEVQQEESMF